MHHNSPEHTRREFFRLSGLGLLTLAVASCGEWPPPNPAPNPTATPHAWGPLPTPTATELPPTPTPTQAPTPEATTPTPDVEHLPYWRPTELTFGRAQGMGVLLFELDSAQVSSIISSGGIITLEVFDAFGNALLQTDMFAEILQSLEQHDEEIQTTAQVYPDGSRVSTLKLPVVFNNPELHFLLNFNHLIVNFPIFGEPANLAKTLFTIHLQHGPNPPEGEPSAWDYSFIEVSPELKQPRYIPPPDPQIAAQEA